MLGKRPQIAFITAQYTKDRRSWSGTFYFMYHALQQHVGDVTLIGPIEPFFATWIGKIATGLSQKIFHKRYNYRHSYLLAKAYASVLNKQLKKNRYDLIVIPARSTFIPYLETDVPIIHIGDSTVQNTMEYYPALTNLYEFSRKETLAIEQAALSKSSLLIYSSQWASDSAIHDFHINPEKVFTIPFGANLEHAPDREMIMTKQLTKTCRLLWLGVDWARKGGDMAFDTLTELIRMGIDAELTICGCVPPAKYTHPKLHVIPYINKNDAEQSKKLDALFWDSDFLILPTRKECFGIVFCEASAFGVPSVTTDTGGISSAVIDGENGFLLPVSATGKDYAKVIAGIFSNQKRYTALVSQSRDLFESTLNWDTWGKKFRDASLPLFDKPTQ